MKLLNNKLIKNILNKYKINITTKEIEEKYNEKYRYYHNIEHINFLNNKILELYEKNIINENERDILIISSLFHDIIYYMGNNDNELKSVEFFKEKINSNDKIYEQIIEIILDTINHESKNKLSKIFSDLDMFIISDGTFDELLNYEKKIRMEAKNYNFELYKQKRIEFLKNILETDYGKKNKINIEKLINYIKKSENDYLIENLKYLKKFKNFI